MNGTAKHEPVKTDAAPEGGSELRFFLIAVVLAAAFALVPRSLSSCRSAQRGEDAPDFTASVVANPLDNKPLTKESAIALASLKGHPVLLDFWATWCGPCQAEAPIVNSVAQRFAEKGLVVIGVNTSDEPGLAEPFALKKGLVFPIVFDRGNAVARAYRVDNLPTLVLISKTGKVVAIRHGVTSAADLERLVRAEL
ncbi:MAG: TlpA family protein disulfide reductase [Myxococcales bacterium]|nr:TlpA family protein disulfide reductase [Myxococcales bacterium]